MFSLGTRPEYMMINKANLVLGINTNFFNIPFGIKRRRGGYTCIYALCNFLFALYVQCTLHIRNTDTYTTDVYDYMVLIL